MKLLGVGVARSIWMFDTNLLNPKGLSLPVVFKELVARYSFTKVPLHPLDVNEQGALAFRFGTFVNSKGSSLNIALMIYNNGVFAETSSSTVDSIEFLRDVTGWLAQEFGFVIPSETDIRKGYLSQITVKFDAPLIVLNPKLTHLLRLIELRLKTLDGKPRQFEFAGLGCWSEDLSVGLAPDSFRFERKWGEAFAANHYFSQAPLETEDHLDLLKELEGILRT